MKPKTKEYIWIRKKEVSERVIGCILLLLCFLMLKMIFEQGLKFGFGYYMNWLLASILLLYIGYKQVFLSETKSKVILEEVCQ